MVFEISASACTPVIWPLLLLWQPGGEERGAWPSQPREPQVSNPFARIQPQCGARGHPLWQWPARVILFGNIVFSFCSITFLVLLQ
ncbi:hypothetical protein CCMA1212_002743 [Trichoderma ghanense]|uniref:SSCRP protein n=1 Tax=Trichoderma ghanense TaxID=65468 RepID=A0ABY2HAM5_9HYPO